MSREQLRGQPAVQSPPQAKDRACLSVTSVKPSYASQPARTVGRQQYFCTVRDSDTKVKLGLCLW
ncbi:hypothetical protein Nmel_001412 [Mimus melanotis]